MTIVQTSLKSKNYNALGIDEIADDITNIITILNSIILYGLPVAADGVTIIGAGTVGDPLIAVGGGTTTTVDISSAQILNWGAANTLLLTELSGNTYYDIEKIIYEFTFDSTVYTWNDDININYKNIDGVFASVASRSLNSLITSTDVSIDTEYTYCCQGLYLNANLSPTLGDGTIRAIITYTVRTFGA